MGMWAALLILSQRKETLKDMCWIILVKPLPLRKPDNPEVDIFLHYSYNILSSLLHVLDTVLGTGSYLGSLLSHLCFFCPTLSSSKDVTFFLGDNIADLSSLLP
jgi:hypothetical protein